VQLPEAFDAAALWRAAPVVVLGWLAWFFGRTLRAGHVPLIERIARVRDPHLTPALCGYTRRLTALWSVYFVTAALLSTLAQLPFLWTSSLIWLGAVALFVGEHRLRPRLFPGRSFPNLSQQIHDTVNIWRRVS
jgi:uncharacterized membrane protein